MDELFAAVNQRLKDAGVIARVKNETEFLSAGEVPEMTNQPSAMLRPVTGADTGRTNKQRIGTELFEVEIYAASWNSACDIAAAIDAALFDKETLLQAAWPTGGTYTLVSLDRRGTRYENTERYWKVNVEIEARVRRTRPASA